jgi:RNA polymerase sigma-70 factor (ECF subfamily)
MAGALNQADDAELAALALGGSEPAYGALMLRHREAVYRLVRAHIGDEVDALDLTQESFISAFAALHRFDRSRPFRAWLLRIALNKCHDWARRRSVRRFFTFARPIEDAAHVADSAMTPEASLQSAAGIERIQRAIQALPSRLKDALVLCAIEGMSQDEAAALIGVSRKTIETRIYRARQKLSEALEGHGSFARIKSNEP